ncbi:MAG: class I SAM-dependent methyltransferase [Sphingomicrobium sp.]
MSKVPAFSTDRTATQPHGELKRTLDWDRMFAEGKWDYLDSAGEAARYALIAGYVHRRSGSLHVLDVGCGAGLLWRYLDHSRVRYMGTDLSAAAIAQATERFPDAEFTCSDLCDYEPAAGERFDAIVFNEVLPHLNDPFRSLRRYLDYLTAGGIAVISTYQNANPSSNAAKFSASLQEALAAGDFKALAGCDVTTFEKGLKWRIDVIAGNSDSHANY